jgi:hypothetical protein
MARVKAGNGSALGFKRARRGEHDWTSIGLGANEEQALEEEDLCHE